MPIRMTTHDEIVCEVDEARAEEAKAILRREMLTLPDWAAGLPLQSEESVCPYYTKAKAALRMNAPSSPASCVRYQQRAATFLYERDAAFLIAPLGAGKGAAALTALAELIRDGQRRHALVIAPKLVADDRVAAGGRVLAAPAASARRRSRRQPGAPAGAPRRRCRRAR